MIKNPYGERWQFGDKLKITNDYRGEMLGTVTFIQYCNEDTDLCLVRDDRGQNYSIRRCNLMYLPEATLMNKYEEFLDNLDDKKSLDSHYKFSYKGIKLDPYRIFNVYGITNAAQQHAIKKLLRAGNSVKGLEQDIKEVIMTLERWVEMINEDEQ